jgi:hypothetical protein
MGDAQNTDKNTDRPKPRRKPPGPPWKPGQSGNPGGRPKGVRSLIQRQVGENAEKLVEAWQLIAFGDDAAIKAKLGIETPPRWQDRMDALKELADRGFGRPVQGLEHDIVGGLVISWDNET